MPAWARSRASYPNIEGQGYAVALLGDGMPLAHSDFNPTQVVDGITRSTRVLRQIDYSDGSGVSNANLDAIAGNYASAGRSLRPSCLPIPA